MLLDTPVFLTCFADKSVSLNPFLSCDSSCSGPVINFLCLCNCFSISSSRDLVSFAKFTLINDEIVISNTLFGSAGNDEISRFLRP